MKKRKINKVLSIEPKTIKGKTCYCIKLNDGVVYNLHQDVLINYPISTGCQLNDNDLKEILSTNVKYKIKDSALNLLAYRMRSKKELYDRLIDKGYIGEDIQNTISGLEEKGWIDDWKFGIAYASDQINKNALGPIAMKYKLKPFLDSEELTNEIILAAYSKINIKDVIKKLLLKFEKDRIALDNKLKNKIINKLRRKGHYWDDINEVIQEYVSS